MESYLRPLRFRVYSEADYEACLAIWRANEGLYFPEGYEPLFTEALREGHSLYLLGEFDGKIVCCGGVAYEGAHDCACLSFGMVAPKLKLRGFGTTLLAARLALLNSSPGGCLVTMEVTAHSFAFYRRFGFEGYDVYTDEMGTHFGRFSRHFPPEDIARCAAMLEGCGAYLPGGSVIPIHE
jgi:GNAT superfamily N-acetyltransferase